MAVLHIPHVPLGRASASGSTAEEPASALRSPALQSPALQSHALRALCRRVFAFRMVMIGLGAPLALGRTAGGGPTYLVGGAILLTFMLSYVLFRDWERFGPLLLRHRWLLAPDLVCCVLLLVTARPQSPLGFAVLCTPLLAGLVYGWRGSAVYAATAAVAVAALAGGPTLPALCLLAGAAGASLRDLLFRFGAAGQALTEARARLAVAEAVRAERDHLAREMHDSVAKTLHGLALAADALARTSDPATVRRQAFFLSGAARAAAAQSRDLLTELRGEGEGAGPSLPAELRRLAGADAELRVRGALPELPAGTAHHLLSITSEALENARRHAGASRVTLTARACARELTLTVEDDGRGLPPDARHLPGRYGLLGMEERARAIGARLTVEARRPGPGTKVALYLPLPDPTGEGSP
ncbi:sensor histidine kinase [Streptomyces vinaceus]|uniref:sensor histidine kinase n=1 Tax=Streptomyces vinaceus TaxID=1960 RepID=UPI0035D57225